MARSKESRPQVIRTVLGGETKFHGILKFQDSLKIDGIFEGTISSPGYLMVESGAEVVANITIGSLVVGGIIKGDVDASDRIEILPGGDITGNVRCPNLVVAADTGFRGRCEMLEDVSGIDVFSVSPERLKNNLSSV